MDEELETYNRYLMYSPEAILGERYYEIWEGTLDCIKEDFAHILQNIDYMKPNQEVKDKINELNHILSQLY